MMTDSSRPAPRWAIALAFTLVYVSWGTTYLAIREGVYHQHLPPALFGGTRVVLAGLILFSILLLKGVDVRFARRDFLWVVVSGLLLFVGGNGLINVAQKTVASGLASILVASTPLWMALLEMFWPRGDRLSARGWLGLFVGLAGVLVLLAPQWQGTLSLFDEPGPLLVLASSWCWSLGSLVIRHQRPRGSHFAAAAYQMIIGGLSLCAIGVLMGEPAQLEVARLNFRAWFAFSYLLIVGSLVGFVAFNWLLGHVSASKVGTYAYVNPLIAVLVGWLIGGEELTLEILAGMVVILSGVALIRTAGLRSPRPAEADQPHVVRGVTGFWQNFAATQQTQVKEI